MRDDDRRCPRRGHTAVVELRRPCSAAGHRSWPRYRVRRSAESSVWPCPPISGSAPWAHDSPPTSAAWASTRASSAMSRDVPTGPLTRAAPSLIRPRCQHPHPSRRGRVHRPAGRPGARGPRFAHAQPTCRRRTTHTRGTHQTRPGAIWEFPTARHVPANPRSRSPSCCPPYPPSSRVAGSCCTERA